MNIDNLKLTKACCSVAEASLPDHYSIHVLKVAATLNREKDPLLGLGGTWMGNFVFSMSICTDGKLNNLDGIQLWTLTSLLVPSSNEENSTM